MALYPEAHVWRRLHFNMYEESVQNDILLADTVSSDGTP